MMRPNRIGFVNVDVARRLPRGHRGWLVQPLIMGLVLLIGVAGRLVHGAEPPQLPVKQGLEAWFDAGRIEAPSDTGDKGVPLAKWPDASGHGRDALQPTESARPRVVRVGEAAVVRFDGVDDHLRVTQVNQALEAATVFLVAAPRENIGGFRAFLAANAKGKRDFETGFTIDLGPSPTFAFSWLNVEGRGFQGAGNLLTTTSPFGALQFLEATIDPQAKTVSLVADGKPGGKRPFNPAPLQMDELTLGARYYTLGGGPQEVRGWLSADIAEVLIYDRVLSETETKQVRAYLTAKHEKLKQTLPATLPVEGQVKLEMVANPPPVQMFVPGFTVRELPPRLTNINNVRYRPDGKLVALAYDGNVYLLEDTDGDGLEDKATKFWENTGRVRSPIGMALTPPDYRLGQGCFVATKSECLLLTDTDGDDRADQEIAVAGGWRQSFHNVDALGVAVDPRDQSIYFGLGTANFADPLLRDPSGKPAYRLDAERGAILHVSPDFSRREVYCTGIRFPVGLAFNRDGDLFATDQEGATWVPNGNPFDELLHIQKGRHYGFPARHPRHLPNVIDEPSVYDYKPQHQSTCGLSFNEPVNGGPTFGPEFWADDALVCGYSRGKLYRTKLVKTPVGYVADNRLIACLNMLTVDSRVTPRGELVVAVHSGGPDWGSGPSGEGKLYKIAYTDHDAPQPVAAWASAADEVRIAFNRPLDLDQLKNLAAETKITFGDYVRAGDEIESLRPGYDVVARQMATPRRELKVFSAHVTPDRRTLILATERQTLASFHAIQLPGRVGQRIAPDAEQPKNPDGTLPRLPRIDLDYSLNGVEVAWTGKTGGTAWNGWLPHVDLTVSRDFTQGSAAHQELWERLAQPGTLRLRTQLDLKNMLRPEVQPGSTLDYELPPETVTVTFESSSPFTLRTDNGEVASRKANDLFAVEVVRGPEAKSLMPAEIELTADQGTPTLTAFWHTAEDDRHRAFPLRRLLLPWAEPPGTSEEVLTERKIPELAGGSWARGRKLFFGTEALCARCHSVRGQGGTIGPDLSNLIHRDYASVVRDLTNPSYALNPDYITHNVELKDGRVLVGTLRSDGDRLLVSDSQGQVTTVARADVEMAAASAKSIMPEGLPQRLGPERLRDLLTFLLMKPPRMPLERGMQPPSLRTKEELRAILAGAPETPPPTRPLRIVLVAGPKDHGPGEHDYPAWQTQWAELLSAAEGADAEKAWEWPSPEQVAAADVMVFYQWGKWTPRRAQDIDAFLKRGGGLVYIHYAVDGGQDAPGFAQRIGLAWQGGRSKFRHGPLELGFETGDSHPIGRNFSKLKLLDESYWNLVGDRSKIQLLATGPEDGEPQPLFWTLEPSGGRVFVSIPGHYSWTFDDPLYRVLLLRAIAWTAREPVDRFNELAVPGARLAD